MTTASVNASRPRRRGPAPAGRADKAPAPDRRTRILRAAEGLFAQFGYHAVTIRRIAEQAEAPLALVRYHCGAKDALFRAVFERWNPVNQRQLALLAEARRSRTPSQHLRGIVQAFAAPVLALLDGEETGRHAALLARELTHPTEASLRAGRDFFDAMARSFLDALQQAPPHATREQIAGCYRYMVAAAMSHVQESGHRRVHGLAGMASPDAAFDSGRLLVDFVVGGIDAAVPRTGQPPTSTACATAPSGLRSGSLRLEERSSS